jgi:hypothetical protein
MWYPTSARPESGLHQGCPHQSGDDCKDPIAAVVTRKESAGESLSGATVIGTLACRYPHIAATITMQLVLARSAGGQGTPASRGSIPGRSTSCMRCRRSCRGVPASSKTSTLPTAWPGLVGPSPVPAAGPVTRATNPQGPLPCEMGSSASTASSMAITSQKMCAQVSPLRERAKSPGASSACRAHAYRSRESSRAHAFRRHPACAAARWCAAP